MATEIKSWEIVEGMMESVNSSLAGNKGKEKEQLEQWIKTNPERDTLIISEQVIHREWIVIS